MPFYTIPDACKIIIDNKKLLTSATKFSLVGLNGQTRKQFRRKKVKNNFRKRFALQLLFPMFNIFGRKLQAAWHGSNTELYK